LKQEAARATARAFGLCRTELNRKLLRQLRRERGVGLSRRVPHERERKFHRENHRRDGMLPLSINSAPVMFIYASRPLFCRQISWCVYAVRVGSFDLLVGDPQEEFGLRGK